MTPEEQAEAQELLAQLRETSVEDLVLHSASLFGSIAFAKLSVKDLSQARLAIDVLKALADTLKDVDGYDLRSVVSNAQLAYANLLGEMEEIDDDRRGA